ncbi:MAG: GFA family protein [Alphaproteobacteria bacterium]|nr:GFA family protein [Alphaproteobacteria bacterium]
MMTTYKGGCACGAIRYETSADPALEGNCHCRDCQRSSGSAMASILLFPKEGFHQEGKAKYHELKADSGRWIRRGFCPECGSPVFTELEMAPDTIAVKAGSLDDPSLYKPAMQLYTSSAQPWDSIPDDGLAKFAKMPDA